MARYVMPARVGGALVAAIMTLCSAAAVAQSPGAKAGREETGGAEALARRVKTLEQRVDSMWSLAQGPEILSLDALDQLATRVLTLEARMASVEKGGSPGTQPPLVAATLALLSSANFPGLVAAARRADPAAVTRARYFVVLVRLTPWPPELKPKADAFDEALSSMMRALSRGEPGEAEALANGVEAVRRQLAAAGLAWSAQAEAPEPFHGHGDHAPRHGGLIAMSGDLHVELVASGSATKGSFEVFLTDAFRVPLGTAALGGAVVLWPDQQRELRLPLRPGSDVLTTVGGVGPGADPLPVRIVLEGLPQGPAELDYVVPPLASP